MADQPTQPAEVVEQVKGKTTFGFGQINSPSPTWASNLFKFVLYLAGLGTLAVGLFTSMADITKVHIAEICSFVTLAVHSASKMFGIQIPDNNSLTTKP